MSPGKTIPPVDTWTDWPMRQNILLQLVRRKLKRKSLIPPAFDDHQSIFVHVPKAAGTSVKQVLFPNARTLTHYRALDYFLDSPLKYRRYFVFAFCRDPYDRLVSAYRYLANGGKNESDRRFHQKHLRSYEGFADFVRHGLGRKEIRRKYHFMPQYLFLVGPRGRIMVDYLGRFERMEEDFAVIADRIGVDARLPHSNRSARGHYSEYYTEELRLMVYQYYRKDFDLLGYSPEISPHQASGDV